MELKIDLSSSLKYEVKFPFRGSTADAVIDYLPYRTISWPVEEVQPVVVVGGGSAAAATAAAIKQLPSSRRHLLCIGSDLVIVIYRWARQIEFCCRYDSAPPPSRSLADRTTLYTFNKPWAHGCVRVCVCVYLHVSTARGPLLNRRSCCWQWQWCVYIQHMSIH